MAEKTEAVGAEASKPKEERYGEIMLPEQFALMSRLILRDLNEHHGWQRFYRFTKDEIAKYLANPAQFEKQIRDACIYIYGASSHFRRIIQYFVGLSDLSYLVEPTGIDPRTANVRITNNNYRKVLELLNKMSIKTQFPKILTVCLREDVFYGTFIVTPDSITVLQLPSDYCQISTVEGNVCNVTFDFSYFSTNRLYLLDYYPEEFRIKYELYKKNGRKSRWIELDSPTSFAIKCNIDILDYAMPPFAGILREVSDLEDYKALKLTKTAIENYALLVMKLPMGENGEFDLDYNKAKDFWMNLDKVMPEEVGSILSPMDIDKISFERSNVGDTNTVADAEEDLFNAAGVSSLLFSNPKASANALLLSIKADQALTYGIVKCIEDMLNRYIQSFSYGKNFRVNFLDVSPFNRKEVGDAYLKAASYGLPTISAYAASQGIGQAELDAMSFLETDVLKLHDMFKPLQNSSQLSASDSDDVGAPKKELGDVSDSTEKNQENE